VKLITLWIPEPYLSALDELEVSCNCPCHDCPDCGSPYCVKMGGNQPCRKEDEDDWDEED